jgi:beta-lactamase class A
MKQLTFIKIFFLLPISVFGQQNEAITHYLNSLDERLEISILVQQPTGEVLFNINADKPIPSASTIKIPILMEFFNQVDAGQLYLDQTYTLEFKDKVGGAGELQFQEDSASLSLEFLAREMIRISDNTATNILIGLVGMENVNLLMEDLGLKSTRLNRLMMDFEAINAGKQNYTSAAEMNKLLGIILSGVELSIFSRQSILNMLLACADKSTIPSMLPEGTRVAHKTGTLAYLRGDAGIILSQNPLIMSIFVENFESLDQADEIIGKIARLAFDEFSN